MTAGSKARNNEVAASSGATARCRAAVPRASSPTARPLRPGRVLGQVLRVRRGIGDGELKPLPVLTNHRLDGNDLRAKQPVVGREVHERQALTVQQPEVMRRQVERVGPLALEIADVLASLDILPAGHEGEPLVDRWRLGDDAHPRPAHTLGRGRL